MTRLPRVVKVHRPCRAAVVMLVEDMPELVELSGLLVALVCGAGAGWPGSWRRGRSSGSTQGFPLGSLYAREGDTDTGAACHATPAAPSPRRLEACCPLWKARLSRTRSSLLQPWPEERPRRHNRQVIILV